VPLDRVINLTSVSISPDGSALYDAVCVIDYELLERIVDDLISDDRQRRIPSDTKLSRFIPTQQRTTRVEAIVLIVHGVALRLLGCVGERDGCIQYIYDNFVFLVLP